MNAVHGQIRRVEVPVETRLLRLQQRREDDGAPCDAHARASGTARRDSVLCHTGLLKERCGVVGIIYPLTRAEATQNMRYAACLRLHS